jgi:AcrR family transcriptional regulator
METVTGWGGVMMYHMVQSWAMAGKDPRGKLLDAAIDHIAARGISDLSLRELAAAIGTSHRMLIHHFGSREALWVEVIRAVEARQRALLAEVIPDPDASVGDLMRQWWAHISDESLWANERLFFEVYGQALQGRPGTVELLDGIVDSWLEPAAQGFMAYGLEREEALAQARLGLAVSRGLLLDLLATGDRDAVDAANEAYIVLIETRLAGYSGPHSPDRR